MQSQYSIKQLALVRIGVLSSYWTVLAGMRVETSPFRKVSTWSFCPPIRRSYSPASDCGRFPTRPLPTVALKPWMSCKRCKPSDAPCESSIRASFVGTRCFDFRPLSVS